MKKDTFITPSGITRRCVKDVLEDNLVGDFMKKCMYNFDLDGGMLNWCTHKWIECKVEGCKDYESPISRIREETKPGE